MYFDTWDIDITTDKKNITELLLDDFKNCKNNKEGLIYFFLDVHKKEFSLVEKLLYDIALFHFKRLGLDINNENYYIECWNHCRDSNSDLLHLDVLESDFESGNWLSIPFLTTLTYFNDISNPTLILDIDNKCFCKGEYENKSAYLSFPKMLKTVSFDGGNNYHGAINFLNQGSIRDNRYIYGMNLWTKVKLSGIEPYSQNIFDNNKMLYHKNIFYIDKNYNLFSFKKNKIKKIYINKLPYKFLFINGGKNCSDNSKYVPEEVTALKDWFYHISNTKNYITKDELLKIPLICKHIDINNILKYFIFDNPNKKMYFHEFIQCLTKYNLFCDNNSGQCKFTLDMKKSDKGIFYNPRWALNPYKNTLFIRSLEIVKEIFLLEFQEVISKLELDIYHDYQIIVKN